MKRTVRTLAAAIALAAAPLGLFGEDFSLVVDDNGTVTGFTGECPETLKIPAVVDGIAVKTIGNGVFSQWYVSEELAVKHLVIARGVERIEAYAFCPCASLESVQFPSTLRYIGDYAFSNCLSLKAITLPASLETIETAAFFQCTSLEDVTFPEGKSAADFPASVFKETPYYAANIAGPAPANDAFEAAQEIAGVRGSVEGTTVDASPEYTDDPESATPPSWFTTGYSSTVWYRWTAPEDGTYRFSIPFGWGRLAAVTSLDAQESCGTGNGRLVFDAEAGTEYFILVGTAPEEEDAFTLSWHKPNPPANDNCERAQEIGGATGSVEGTTVDASQEYPDALPDWLDGNLASTVWYRWTAPAYGTYRLTVNLASNEGRLAVTTGYDEATRGWSDWATDNYSGELVLNAAAGLDYLVTVGTYPASERQFTLDWKQIPEPANTEIAKAEPIEGASASGFVMADNTLAPGEADATLLELGYGSTFRTLWWEWTAPESGTYYFDTLGSAVIYPRIAAFRSRAALGADEAGDAASADEAGDAASVELVVTSSNWYADDCEISFAAEAGEKFYLAVGIDDSYVDYAGELRLNWELDDGSFRLKVANGTITGYRGTVPESLVIADCLPEGATAAKIGANAFDWQGGLKAVTIPESVTEIETGAFNGCTALEEVVFEGGREGVTIADSAFDSTPWANAGNMPTVLAINEWWEDGVEEIVGIHGSVPEEFDIAKFIPADAHPVRIGESAFYSRGLGLKTVTIPDCITEIKHWAFAYNQTLETIAIPATLQAIGWDVFYSCGSLKTVTFPATCAVPQGEVFCDCAALGNVFAPVAWRDEAGLTEESIIGWGCPDAKVRWYSGDAPVLVTIAFDAQGGALESGSIETLAGEEIGTTPTPVREGFLFGGWFTAAEGGERVTAATVATEDLTLYARWAESPFSGGSDNWWIDDDGVWRTGETTFSVWNWDNWAEVEVTGPAVVTFQAASQGGEFYAGLIDENREREYWGTYVSGADWTDWAVYVPEGTFYLRWIYGSGDGEARSGMVRNFTVDTDFQMATVTYDPNGGILKDGDPKTTEAPIGYKISTIRKLRSIYKPEPVWAGEGYCEFAGWYSAPGDDGEYDFVVEGDTTLYAHWDEVEPEVEWDVYETDDGEPYGVIYGIWPDGAGTLEIPASVEYEDADGNPIQLPVTMIEAGAFEEMSFSKVVIPASVTQIAYGAFYNCSRLEEVEFEGDIEAACEIVYREFANTPWLKKNYPPPANDEFGNAETVEGASGSVNGTLTAATIADDDCIWNFGDAERTVWYKWTAPVTGRALFRATATGKNLDDDMLYLVSTTGRDDDSGEWLGTGYNNGNIVAFDAEAGTTYYVSVCTWDFEPRDFALSWSLVVTPENDERENAIWLSGASGSVKGTTVGATGEGDDPISIDAGGEDSIQTVWYRWTAPAEGKFSFSVASQIGFTIAILDGSGCVAIEFADVSIEAKQGTEYLIEVGGAQAEGDFTLAWQPPPANDKRENAIELSGASGRLEGSTVGATTDGDDIHSNTVWYKWTAPKTGTVTFDLAGSTYGTAVDVFVPRNDGGIDLVASSADYGTGTVPLSVDKGNTYLIAIGSIYGQGGFALSWTGNFIPFTLEVENGEICGFSGDEPEVLNLADYLPEGEAVYAIADGAFIDTRVVELVVPEGIEAIGSEAFSGCDRLKKVSLPASLQTVGEAAFSCCPVLEDVSFAEPESNEGEWLEILGDAFYRCESLGRITLPAQLGLLGSNAFDSCTALESVVFNGTASDNELSIDSRAFGYCSSLASITLPENLSELGDAVFCGTRIAEIVLPDNPDNVFNARNTMFSAMVADDGVSAELRSAVRVLAPRTVDREELYSATLSGDEELDFLYRGSEEIPTVIDLTVEYYTIVVLDPGEGTLEGDARIVSIGDTMGELPVPVREGYTFNGWRTEGGAIVSASTLWTDDTATVLLSAGWEKEPDPIPEPVCHTVSFDSGVTATLSRLEGEALGQLPVPATREGYTFTGWFAGETAVTSETVMGDADLSLTAKWTLNAWTVSFDCVDTVLTVAYGAALGQLPVPAAREGYTFGGWFAGETAVTSETVMGDSDLALVAKWSKVIEAAEVVKISVGGESEGGESGGGGTSSSSLSEKIAEALEGVSLVEGEAYGEAVEIITEVATESARHGKSAAALKTSSGETVTAETIVSAGDTLSIEWETFNPLAPEEDEAVETAAAQTYDAYVINAADETVGTVQVKVGKPNKKSGLAAVTATVTPVGGKKMTFKATEAKGKATIDTTGVSDIPLACGGDTMTLSLGASGVEGICTVNGAVCEIGGIRNTAKTGAADYAKWMRTVNVLFHTDGAGYSTMTVTVAAKGKVKIAGTMADGTKLSATAQLMLADNGTEACVAVASAKKSAFAFMLWLAEDGAATVESASDWNGKALAFVDAGEATAGADRVLSFVADGGELGATASITLAGGRLVCPKADKVKAAKGEIAFTPADASNPNPAGVKLSLAAKTGVFKGSYTAYTLVNGKLKKLKATVTGVFVNAKGYGTAVIKGQPPIPVTLE